LDEAEGRTLFFWHKVKELATRKEPEENIGEHISFYRLADLRGYDEDNVK